MPRDWSTAGPGDGTTVVGQKHLHGLDRLQGLAEVWDGRGTVHNEVRALAMTRPPSAVREHLRLGPHDDVLFVERLRHLDGVPLSLDLTYLVPDLGAALLGRDLAATDVFTLLEEVAGGPLGHADRAVEAVAADPHSAAVLGVPPARPAAHGRAAHPPGRRPARGPRVHPLPRLRREATRSRGFTATPSRAVGEPGSVVVLTSRATRSMNPWP